LWRQWQELASLWAAPPPDSRAQFGREGAFGLDSFTAAAERFAAEARSFLDGVATAPAPAADEAARVFSDFLREQFSEFRLPWSSGLGAGASHGVPPSSMGDSPAFGATREHQQRWQRMAEASRRIGDAQRRLQRLWSDALREAAAAFAARLVSPDLSGVSAEGLRKLYDTWIDCAEEAYARVAQGETFCNALAEYVNASSQWRRELQASVEHLAKLLDLPTRSEINTLTQRLKSVEGLLRATQNKRNPQIATNRTPRGRRKAKP
jgi:hypothetical protein